MDYEWGLAPPEQSWLYGSSQVSGWERARKEGHLVLDSGAHLEIKEILDLHAFFCTNTKGQPSLVFDLIEQVLASNVNPPEGEQQFVKTPLRFPLTLLCWTKGKILWMCVRDKLAALTESEFPPIYLWKKKASKTFSTDQHGRFTSFKRDIAKALIRLRFCKNIWLFLHKLVSLLCPSLSAIENSSEEAPGFHQFLPLQV